MRRTKWKVGTSLSIGMTLCLVSAMVIGLSPSVGAAQNRSVEKPKVWTIEKSPAHFEEPSSATGISCASTTKCVAVGSFVNPAGIAQPLGEVWKSSSWSYTKIPTPALNERFADYAQFNSVSCDSKTNCIAVGWMSDGNSDPAYSFAAEFYDSQWVVNPSAEMGAPSNPDYLSSVSCVTGPYCMAVGWGVPNGGTWAIQPFVELLDGGTWSQVQTPTQTSTSSLSGVSCTSSSDCVAVGKSGSSPLTETWNGSEWSVQPAPLPTGSTSGSFTSVSCPTPTGCGAVGTATTSTGAVALSEIWNGTTWQLQNAVDPSGASSATLTAVSCTAVDSCSAVGNYSPLSGTAQGFGEVWNGKKWRLESVPARKATDTTALSSVSCVGTTPASCFSVGSVEPSNGDSTVSVYRTVGSAWTVMRTPQVSNPIVYLTGVTCSEQSSCEAVGSDLNPNTSNGTTQGIAMGWDGTKWAVQQTPMLYYDQVEPLPSPLNGVSCAAGTLDCVSVGSGTSTVTGQPVAPIPWADAWDGSGAWTVSIDTFTTATLNGVSCYAAGKCVAVGINDTSRNEPLIYSIGKTVKQQTPAVPSGSTQSPLNSVSCESKTFCIAVGTYVDSSNDTVGFAESWNGSTWQLQVLPALSNATDNVLNGISCESNDSCVAVGEYSSGGKSYPDAFSWNGSSWQESSPSGPAGAAFTGVSCTADSCVAVGSKSLSSGATAPLAETWDGTSWTAQAVSVPKGATTSTFTGVSCYEISCMAVGYSTDASGTAPLTEVSAG